MNSSSSGTKSTTFRIKQLAIAVAVAAVPLAVMAGDHWMSRLRVQQPGKQDVVVPSVRQAGKVAPGFFRKTDAKTVFDITISLDAYPKGDDDWTTDSGALDAEQREYEEKLEEFARTVYQSTNGALKIGIVTIYREGRAGSSVDVIWTESCAIDQGPRAHNSGFGVAGNHLWMCSKWPGAPLLMDTAKGGGYTLAHEWGHFAFGLFDEYAQEQCDTETCDEAVPRGTDTAAKPSIMNSQWRALLPFGRDYLEFSTQNIEPYKADSTGTNAQKRVFGESGWQTLTRDSATDPKFHFLPERTRYSALAAPLAPNWLADNDEGPALSDLSIRWAGREVIGLAMDVSGSMAGTPLTSAKTGAALLIDQLPGGTAVGVHAFATDARAVFPFVEIPESLGVLPDPGVVVRDQLKASIGGLAAGGVTSLYDGLILALADMQAFDKTTPGSVFVLSDGEDNDSVANEDDVIAAYKAAGATIVSFAYGSFAPTGTLHRMATETGGRLYVSPTTLVDIQAALFAAGARYSSSVLLNSQSISAAPSAKVALPLAIDSTLDSVRVNLAFAGNVADVGLRVLLPDGRDSGVAFNCQGAVSCSAGLDEAFLNANGDGNYAVEIVNKVMRTLTLGYVVDASPRVTSYDISAAFSDDTVVYPRDLALYATVAKGPAIAGLDVKAIVAGPAGVKTEVTLLDDGTEADRLANDGTYTVSIPYRSNGIYSAVVTASNPAGRGRTTFEGVLISLREDGTGYVPASTPVTENFVRTDSVTARVEDVAVDDHANNPAGGTCTRIAPDNVDAAGRVDFGGDADCFQLAPASAGERLVVRATRLTLAMDPILEIYDHTGYSRIVQVDLSGSRTPENGVVWTLPAENRDPDGQIIVIKHKDSSVRIGGYLVSAGDALTSDGDSTPPTITADVTGVLGNNGWYKGDVQVRWSVSDSESSLTSQVGCDSRTISTDTAGVKLTCVATSAGGTGEQSVDIKRDTGAPIITIGAPSSGGRYKQDTAVAANYGCDDATSMVVTCQGTAAIGQSIDTRGSGSKIFVVTAEDAAGNRSSSQVTYEVKKSGGGGAVDVGWLLGIGLLGVAGRRCKRMPDFQSRLLN